MDSGIARWRLVRPTSICVLLVGVALLSGCTPAAERAETPAASLESPEPAPADPSIQPPAVVADTASGAVPFSLVNAAYDAATATITASAIVPDRVTGDGTCTLVVTRDADTVTAAQASLPYDQLTYCSDLTVALPSPSGGSWAFTFDYTDASGSGTLTGRVDVP